MKLLIVIYPFEFEGESALTNTNLAKKNSNTDALSHCPADENDESWIFSVEGLLKDPEVNLPNLKEFECQLEDAVQFSGVVTKDCQDEQPNMSTPYVE